MNDFLHIFSSNRLIPEGEGFHWKKMRKVEGLGMLCGGGTSLFSGDVGGSGERYLDHPLDVWRKSCSEEVGEIKTSGENLLSPRQKSSPAQERALRSSFIGLV